MLIDSRRVCGPMEEPGTKELPRAQLLEKHEQKSDADLEYAVPELTMADLPPMPEPDTELMRTQSCGGVSFVTVAVAVCIGITQGIALGLGSLPSSAWWLIFCLVYGEAIVAFSCLGRILYGDTGEIKRSPETCFPLPDEVTERIHKGESLEGLDNIRVEDRSYCVRCCVWRDHPAATEPEWCCSCERHPHHCRVCGRCVEGFDQCARSVPRPTPQGPLPPHPDPSLCQKT